MSGFAIVAAVSFLLSFLGCVAYLWYDQLPAVQTQRELRFLMNDSEEIKQEARHITEATKAVMDQIASERQRS